MARTIDYLAASRAAAEVARWAMHYGALKHEVVSPTVVNDLSVCASALGYKLVKAEAPATGDA